MARPRKRVDTIEVLRLRLAGFSWPQIARLMALGQGTVYRAYREAIEALQPFQNPKAAKLRVVANLPADPGRLRDQNHPDADGLSCNGSVA